MSGWWVSDLNAIQHVSHSFAAIQNACSGLVVSKKNPPKVEIESYGPIHKPEFRGTLALPAEVASLGLEESPGSGALTSIQDTALTKKAAQRAVVNKTCAILNRYNLLIKSRDNQAAALLHSVVQELLNKRSASAIPCLPSGPTEPSNGNVTVPIIPHINQPTGNSGVSRKRKAAPAANEGSCKARLHDACLALRCPPPAYVVSPAASSTKYRPWFECMLRVNLSINGSSQVLSKIGEGRKKVTAEKNAAIFILRELAKMNLVESAWETCELAVDAPVPVPSSAATGRTASSTWNPQAAVASHMLVLRNPHYKADVVCAQDLHGVYRIEHLCIPRETVDLAFHNLRTQLLSPAPAARTQQELVHLPGQFGYGGGVFDMYTDALRRPLRPVVYPATDTRAIWAQMSSSPTYKSILQDRSSLPAFASSDRVKEMIKTNPAVLIVGETGCGKTTQVPHFVFEDCMQAGIACNIIVTQPRRIAALSVANRVARELGEGAPGNHVGYAVRHNSLLPQSRSSNSGSILFCTTGTVLRMMQDDPQLEKVTHLIIDEVHERDIETDFLLILARDLILLRPDLRIVLMSATVDVTEFSSYFGGGTQGQMSCPVLEIPGRTFPVRTSYLDDVIDYCNYSVHNATLSNKRRNFGLGTTDGLLRALEDDMPYDLLVTLIKQLCNDENALGTDGAILVFLPGWEEISRLQRRLFEDGIGRSEAQVLPLHSKVSLRNQQAVFNPPQAGRRKVVLATNIAESSVTLKDIVCVVDSGKVNQPSYDAYTGTSLLKTVFVSRASADQRAGRAGRVRSGLCYRLYRESVYHHRMSPSQEPEMLRTPLEELCMRVLAMPQATCQNESVASVLNRAMNPPPSQSVMQALHSLCMLGAIEFSMGNTGRERLTPLGRLLIRIPISPSLGKALVIAAALGVHEEVAMVAAGLSCRDLFNGTGMAGRDGKDNQDSRPNRPMVVPSRATKRKLASVGGLSMEDGCDDGAGGDMYTFVNAMLGWFDAQRRRQESEFVDTWNLSYLALTNMQKLYELLIRVIEKNGLTGQSRMTVAPVGSRDRWELATVALCAGMPSNLLRRKEPEECEGKPKFRSAGCCTETFNSKSVINDIRADRIPLWVIYDKKVRVFVSQCQLGCPLGVLSVLFALDGEMSLFYPDSQTPDNPQAPSSALTQPQGTTSGTNSAVAPDASDSDVLLFLQDWIAVRMRYSTAVAVYELRRALQSRIHRFYLEPQAPITPLDVEVVNTLRDFLRIARGVTYPWIKGDPSPLPPTAPLLSRHTVEGRA
eukprot:Rmarinus@m.5855